MPTIDSFLRFAWTYRYIIPSLPFTTFQSLSPFTLIHIHSHSFTSVHICLIHLPYNTHGPGVETFSITNISVIFKSDWKKYLINISDILKSLGKYFSYLEKYLINISIISCLVRY